MEVPPLVTTSVNGGRGLLHAPDTLVLVGADFDSQDRNGARGTLGWWLDQHQTVAVEGSYLWLSDRRQSFRQTSTGAPLLAQPFFNISPGAGFEDSIVLASPGLFGGGVLINELSRFWGGEANLRLQVMHGCGYHFDVIAGYRYLELDEGFSINESSAVLPTIPVVGGTTLSTFSGFGAHNRFHGGQLGGEASFHHGRFFVDVRGKVALGTIHESVNIGGTTVSVNPSGTATVLPGGPLALSTNSGRFNRDEFSVVPEAGINVGCQLTPHLRASFGYTFLAWTQVLRPAEQIDRTVNITQLPPAAGPTNLVGAPRPAFNFRDTDFWAQGLNFGLEFRF
jgi:hypothetical protein